MFGRRQDDPHEGQCRPGYGAAMLIAILSLTLAVTTAAQEPTPQKLFEAGKFQEAVDKVKARADAPQDQVYLRALAHRRLDQNDDAKQAFGALASAGEGSAWGQIGKSGSA